MIYIYNDFGGTHTTVLAASYHLNKLDVNREPTKTEILASHNFNKLVYKDRGKLYFHGTDEEGNQVYTMGRGRSKILIPGIYNLIQMLLDENVLHEKIILSNTSPTVPLSMTMGGMLSRWLKIDFIGVPLLVMGAKQAYKDIVNLVHQTKQAAKISASQLVMLENKGLK
ncbi:DUF3189 family protein [Paenibacillus radicis (ex Xue et al. 2023)]|uniref:DUF3189 family protein n=1 Tax=Paenibacillus radicis (ex Xue et al. 2023) TaxID=2972489 RepID=A0ABT1YMD2_9BACL|nr:DUF3189 family protein [Paenibacillus radicis (ex Xue et al. 2023)]MCR8634338.1 DUF3189 family protein [Paenibacillus radicis (ex Xue et al. 2023)]